MKFRTLGVALLMGSGLALTAIAASPAVAQPYPPEGCTGPSGTGTVTAAVVEVGEEVTFSGCGFEPSTIVQIAVDGVPFDTTSAEADTTFSIVLTFDTPGLKVLTATGQQTITFSGLAAGTEAEPSTGGATGVEAVPDQAPFLARVVTANVLVKEKDKYDDDKDHDDKPDRPKDDVQWGGEGGWGGEGSEGGYGGEGSEGGYGGEGSEGGYGGEGSEGGYGGEGSEGGYGGEGSEGGPSGGPSGDPSGSPSNNPSGSPSGSPSVAPSGTQSVAPTVAPVASVTPQAAASAGGLPFTGVETGALAAIAVALVGGGLLIRVAARKRQNSGGTHS